MSVLAMSSTGGEVSWMCVGRIRVADPAPAHPHTAGRPVPDLDHSAECSLRAMGVDHSRRLQAFHDGFGKKYAAAIAAPSCLAIMRSDNLAMLIRAYYVQ